MSWGQSHGGSLPRRRRIIRGVVIPVRGDVPMRATPWVVIGIVVANVLTWDYVGALAASLLFPLVLIPELGLVRSSLFFGLINVVVALWTIRIFRYHLIKFRSLVVQSMLLLAVLLSAFLFADRFVDFVEGRMFGQPVVISHSSPYQRIVVTELR